MTIKLSRMADYAVTLMAVFARSQETSDEAGLMTVSALAAKTGLSEATVSQILKKLTRQKLLNSCRGVNGGYSLAMGAETITMAHVVEAMDGPISLTRCLEKNHTCCYAENCNTKDSWAEVNNAVREALNSMTLKDICR